MHRSHVMLSHVSLSHVILSHWSHVSLSHWSHVSLPHWSHVSLSHWSHVSLSHWSHVTLSHRSHSALSLNTELTFLFSQVRSQGHQRPHLPLLSRKKHQIGDYQEEFKVLHSNLDQKRNQPSGFIPGCAQFLKSYNFGQLSQAMGCDC